MSTKLASWIADHGVSEVECIVPDMNGVQRGKVLPAGKFLSSVKDGTLRIPGVGAWPVSCDGGEG